ncbi:SAM-dependent methyltransferase [uncultured Sphingomonas sp.]|uniref:SAM-dependent methyltransferase n=1 Tax=uncultured Sphingomonas sp. TaxID=158754 RepID=UPI0025F2D5B1|nr:SAM-dependent methyltransferase [uncultured Sphingomonas sp.]
MTGPIFDDQALALRRQRAVWQGPRLFLAERAVEDLADRLSLVQRRFGRALLVGCLDPRLAEPLTGAAEQVIIAPTLNDVARFPPGSFDLLLVLGQLDTANELRAVLHILRAVLTEEALFVGAFPGNNSLPALRAAMLAADRAGGAGAAPRVHPRIEASAIGGLLQDAGFVMPVVDIDRVRLSYRTLDDLVADLRGMGATNVLSGRSRTPLLRTALATARTEFAQLGAGERTVETVELIHFAAWTQPASLTAA